MCKEVKCLTASKEIVEDTKIVQNWFSHHTSHITKHQRQFLRSKVAGWIKALQFPRSVNPQLGWPGWCFLVVTLGLATEEIVLRSHDHMYRICCKGILRWRWGSMSNQTKAIVMDEHKWNNRPWQSPCGWLCGWLVAGGWWTPRLQYTDNGNNLSRRYQPLSEVRGSKLSMGNLFSTLVTRDKAPKFSTLVRACFWWKKSSKEAQKKEEARWSHGLFSDLRNIHYLSEFIR